MDLPSAFNLIETLAEKNIKPALFLDFDGTLSPIVPRFDDAILPESTRQAILMLKDICPIAIVSGRDRADVMARVGINDLTFAGCHGFDILGPDIHFDFGEDYAASLDQAEQYFTIFMADIPGAFLERKRYGITLHYRMVPDADQLALRDQLIQKAETYDKLKVKSGKKIVELVPDFDWHKGKALTKLIAHFNHDHHAIFIGDDVTDEDGFKAIKAQAGVNGTGIVVWKTPRDTAADYALSSPAEVCEFLHKLAQALSSS